MRLFNSIQAVAMYASGPFVVSWLSREDFPGHHIATMAAGLLYVVGTFAMIYCVYSATEPESKSR